MSAEPIPRTTSTLEPSTKSSKQSKSWAKRQIERQKIESVKNLEKQIKLEAETVAEKKKEANRIRKAKIAEKERLEKLSLKLSQKKLARMKKRLGRSKKVSG